MSESSEKRRKRYVDNFDDRSKHTSLIYVPGNSSYEYRVLGDFGSKYSKRRPTKDRGNDNATRKKFNRQQ